ncbi:MAG: hypothetical protein ACKVGW_03835, partial [Verrucomicrobiia bacterium]
PQQYTRLPRLQQSPGVSFRHCSSLGDAALPLKTFSAVTLTIGPIYGTTYQPYTAIPPALASAPRRNHTHENQCTSAL